MTTIEANARCDDTGHVFDKGTHTCRCGRSHTSWPRADFIDERWGHAAQKTDGGTEP